MIREDMTPVVTPAVANVICSLQADFAHEDSLTTYLISKLDEVSRWMLFDADLPDGELVDRMRALQMIRDNLLTIANPPDASAAAAPGELKPSLVTATH